MAVSFELGIVPDCAANTVYRTVLRFQALVDMGTEGFVWPANTVNPDPYIETLQSA